jgi:hypothetical protein
MDQISSSRPPSEYHYILPRPISSGRGCRKPRGNPHLGPPEPEQGRGPSATPQFEGRRGQSRLQGVAQKYSVRSTVRMYIHTYIHTGTFLLIRTPPTSSFNRVSQSQSLLLHSVCRLLISHLMMSRPFIVFLLNPLAP